MTNTDLPTSTDLKILNHPDLPGVEIYLTYITPKMATEFLADNHKGQRNINRDVVARYAEDMTAGFWLFSGAAVLFDKENQVIDGQHRLTAIVETGQAQLTLIVAGLDTSVLHAIDAGRKKTYGTLLAMKYDRPSADGQASAIRAYWYWFHGCYGGRGVSRVAVQTPQTNALPTVSQLEICRNEVEERLSITFTQAIRVAANAYNEMPRITVTVWALVWVLLTEYDIDARERFFHELLVEPLSPSADYPINTLRNTLGRIKMGEWDRTMQLHAVLKTFEHWRVGRTLPTLRPPAYFAWNTLAQPPVRASEEGALFS
jgi:hypothetical protein